jgi:hypothetical protein
MALGASSNVTGAQGVGVGIYTQVNTSQSAAVGYGSVTSSGRPNVVSVGSGGTPAKDSNGNFIPIAAPNTRIIENVTNGQYSQDAATVNQLPGQFVTASGAPSSTPTNYYRFGNDATQVSQMTTLSSSVTLRNVNAGVNTTDAANVGQLPGTITYSGGQGTVTMGNAAAPGGNNNPVDVQNVHNLTAAGTVQGAILSSTGNATVGQNLTVVGTTITNGINNTGNISTGTLNSTGNITSNGTVQGATLTDGTATLNHGNLSTTGSVNAGSVATTGNATVGGNTTVNGALSVVNGANFNNKTITGVAPGTLSATSTEAVNGSQLYAAINQANQYADKVGAMANRHADAVAAMAAATSMTPMFGPKGYSLTVATANVGSQSALGIGFARSFHFKDNPAYLQASVGFNGSRTSAVKVGASIGW